MIQNSEALVLGFKSAVAGLKDELSCAICFNPFDDPVLIDGCSHIFCKACLKTSTNHAGRKCPLCRAEFDKIAAMRFLPALSDKVTATLRHLAPVTQLLEDLSSRLERSEDENDHLHDRKEHYKLGMLRLQEKVAALRRPRELLKDLEPPPVSVERESRRDSTEEREQRLKELKERMEELRSKSSRARAELKHKSRMAQSYSILIEGSLERRSRKRGILNAPRKSSKVGRSMLTQRSRRGLPPYLRGDEDSM